MSGHSRESRTPMPAIPRILFAAPSSGSGKTVVTCGFLALCKKRGLDVRAMKCGPDYIDPMFHHYVLGIPGANLDSFFLNDEGVRALLLQEAGSCGIAVMEGVMGYYDGLAGISASASSYDIARITDTPVVLVVDGKWGSVSLAALVKGFQEFRRDSRICGVILNRASEAGAARLRPHIEALGLHLAGWVPECEEANFSSRHLGLTVPSEQVALREKIDALAERMETGLGLDWLFSVAAGAGTVAGGAGPGACPSPSPSGPHRGICRFAPGTFRIAVARDEAFSFYYQENLRLLRELGAELDFFSPLRDEALPAGAGAILLGGGYPELFAKQLSDNRALRAAIQAAAASGVKILAECGGFLYLHQALEGADGNHYPMVGVVAGRGFRTSRLGGISPMATGAGRRFGYLSLLGRGGEIKGHEFHYWDSDNPGESCLAVKPLSDQSWRCMHQTDTLLAGFPHLYYKSNPDLVYRFLVGELKL